ncbi:MAG TPA: hypothetical protein VMV17_17045 [Streptosporangiaceae bacterium]|nr:hypothetical protein [Streptosporangiaceae bacterium]
MKRTGRLAAVIGSTAAAGLLVTTVTSASATALRAAAPAARPVFTLEGMVSGGIKVIQPGQMLTFVFTETSMGPGSASEDLVIVSVKHASIASNPPCVLPGGVAINSDSSFCEPGFIAPGQSASMVITTDVTGGPGTVASVRVCLDDEGTGALGPCRTVPMKIA